MKRLLPSLAIALLALTSCGGGDPPGDVRIYWQFSHTKQDGSAAIYDATPAGTCQTYCPQSGVDYVTIVDGSGRDVDPAYPTLNCVNELGDQGVDVRAVGPGTHTWTITGYRTTSSGDVALYETQFTFNVASGHLSDLTVTVPGIADNLDLQAVMSTSAAPPQPVTCAQIGAASVSYSIVDWAGTETRFGTFPCSGGLPTVALGAVERDNYAVRLQALSATGAPLGDTLIPAGQGCSTDPTFDHYGANDRASIPVYDIRAFGTTCP